ncbi:hypothetical protein BGZ82_010632 [Podila clonocystis]|nr:hypothetical protein BGZ82_010632 [Podila clonocystis]
MPHMLQRQLSRTLCDEYTNIFDDALSQSHVQAPMLVSMSEVSSRSSSQCFLEEASALLLPPSPVSLKAMETSSWSPSSVGTPGFSPSSETDDSALFDSLSSPASPLFPVLQTSPVAEVVGSITFTAAAVAQGSVSCSPEMLFAEDDDFFHNSFYRSLDQGRFQSPPVAIDPHSQKQTPCSLDSSYTTISDNDQKSALTTAAPSEIFNVSMHELLSVDPFQLSQATSCSSSSTSTQNTEMASELAMETEKMASFVATLASEIELSQATDLDDLDYGFSETSTLSDVSDDSDGDYVMASPISKNTINNKRKPSSSSKATKRRPRQEAKNKRSRPTVQKTPKVYPPRKPRTKATESGSDTNMADVVTTILASDGTVESSGSSSSPKCAGQKSRTILSHPDGGFLCDQCPGERFGRVHDLKRHQDSKHFVMTWPCDFCHRPFVRRDALLRHYVVKSARHDGIHPTESESHRLYEAKARAKARC